MIKQKKGKLLVEAEGKRLFISVPAGLSNDLHLYLRENRVQSAPPEPAFTGFDNIELRKGSDAEGVQALLNAWR
jgi:hypothetical protein